MKSPAFTILLSFSLTFSLALAAQADDHGNPEKPASSPSFATKALRTGASFLLLKYGEPVDPKDVKVEPVSTDSKVSINAEVTRANSDLIVTGSVHPNFGYYDPPTWRKVKVQILDHKGKVIAQSSGRWSLVPLSPTPRTSFSMKRWPFQIKFHGMPAQGITVRMLA